MCVVRRDLIGGQIGGFKGGCCKMWLRISPLSMIGQMQMFLWENDIRYTLVS